MVDMQLAGLDQADAAGAVGRRDDVEPAEIDDVVRGDVHGDPDGAAAGLDATDSPFAIDGDGFAYGHRAEAAGVQTVDLATRRRLGERPGEGQARRGPATGIAVISHARDPGTRRLCVSRRDCDAEGSRCKAKARKDVRCSHGYFLSWKGELAGGE